MRRGLRRHIFGLRKPERRHIKIWPPDAFRLILDHLTTSTVSDNLKVGMAAALGRREARDVVWFDVIRLYRERPDDRKPDHHKGIDHVCRSSEVKDRLGYAIRDMARPSDLDTIIELISDTTNGASRICFVKNLTRSRNPKALATLVQLRDDPDLRIEIEFKLKAKLKRVKSPFRLQG